MGKVVVDGFLAGMAWMTVHLIWLGEPGPFLHTWIWVLAALTIGLAHRSSLQHYRMVSMKDAAQLALATLFLVLISLALRLAEPFLHVHSSTPKIAFGAALLTGILWATFRFSCRELSEVVHRHQSATSAEVGPVHRTLIIGAGRAGALVTQEIQRHPNLGYEAVGLVDDSPAKRNVRIQGVPVLGSTAQLTNLIQEQRITHAILAIPSAPGPVIRKLTKTLQDSQIQIKTVPGVYALLGAQTWKPVIQDVSIEDILRRDSVQLDHSALTQALSGAVLVITGAGGSIGSELARQVAAFTPKHIVLLGRGENSLWEVQRSLANLYPHQSISMELVDIRNRTGLREVFERYRPDVVLHAAAHKHVPFLETHPIEAVQNNIFGTLNVVEAALDFGAGAFVNISTDKAVNPTNVLGASKRIAELVVLDAARKAGDYRRFVSVRFGNVLGSRGSVVPIFRDQIKKGGPITVTHPEMTRYFMTIPEASQLVIQAGMLGNTARVYLLDMGEAVRIVDLARDMARLSGFAPGKDIEIQFVGLRPGEKLHEELCLEKERISTRVHPKLFEVAPQGLTPEALEEALRALQAAIQLPYEQRQPEIVKLLQTYVPTYKPSLLGVGRFGGHVKDRRRQPHLLPPGAPCRRRH
ncbi:polysaccharide biosynthesis protein [Holophaga foetida]|uniref:polysaccharide biosynthesis protein n=1 Tax=Holophaga foetida TaxID=35839 RepID=UPI00130D9890|nr:nucleoside-diphosphate sugar epimerase/dehydratase [Holophaga foetida]